MNKLLQNKVALFSAIGAVVLVIVFIIILSASQSGKNGSYSQGEDPQAQATREMSAEGRKRITNDKDLELLKSDNLGKVLEIQSILAREGIQTDKKSEGSKYTISLAKNTTIDQKDRALLVIVRSGIMDRNIGLEIFDKSDFMASKDEKKIRLLRATNGELSRLIKKIEPIEDASVFISIPEDTIFTTEQEPVTATVQVVLPLTDDRGDPVDKLDRDKVRSITNLLLGAVTGLEAKNISITDTNGNVYSSIMSPEDDMMTLLEERDHYMKGKVMAQLDKLVGKGNYVVTVSTYLREAPLEASKIVYNPKASSITSAQRFRESLGDRSSDVNKYSAAVSSYIPGGLPFGGDSASDRSYARTAEEYQYGVGKMQVSESKSPGMIEEISIAVTLDRAGLPSDISMNDLKELIANAASPKAKATNVKIAFSEINSALSPSQDDPTQMPVEEGNPWWIVILIFSGVMIVGLVIISAKAKYSGLKQQEEIDKLNERAMAQENMIKEAHNRAAKLQEMQEKMHTSMVQQQQQQPKQPAITTLQETLADIKGNIIETADERDIAKTLKTWIESTG